jgi:hypothetical protein
VPCSVCRWAHPGDSPSNRAERPQREETDSRLHHLTSDLGFPVLRDLKQELRYSLANPLLLLRFSWLSVRCPLVDFP